MIGAAMVHPATRRRFLSCASVILAGTVVASTPARWSFADDDAQWARLQRGLSQKSMAGCRKAADRLAPRLGALLKGPQWESQMFRAIEDELKQVGVYPDRPPAPGPGCAAASGADGAAVATLPGIGPMIAAVLALVAAVIVLIGQIIAKGLEDQAAAKERDERNAKVSKLKRKATDEVARRDDCTLFAKKPD